MSLQDKVTGAFNKIAASYPQAVQTGTVQRTTHVGGGPSDPTGGASTPTTASARMAVFEVSADRIDGTNILMGDWQVIVEPIVSPTAFEIASSDEIIVAQGTLKIKRLGKINPQGTTLAYDMICSG